MRDKLMFLVGFGTGCLSCILLDMMATELVIVCVLLLCMAVLVAIGLAIHGEE